MSTNRTFSNREPRQSRKGLYQYETRTCETCGKSINSPKGKAYPCVYCGILKDSRVARRDSILAILQEEPVTMEQALEYWTELAEIDQALQFKPADLVIEEFPY